MEGRIVHGVDGAFGRGGGVNLNSVLKLRNPNPVLLNPCSFTVNVPMELDYRTAA